MEEVQKYQDLVARLQDHARRTPDKIALIFLRNGESEQSITYGELDRQARAVAVYLVREGLERQPVLLIYSPGIDFAVSFVACLYAGVIAVPVAFPGGPQRENTLVQIQAIAEDTHSRLIMTDDCKALTAACAKYPAVQSLHCLNIRTLNKGLSADYQELELNPDGISHLQYTSGSSSHPKGVVTRHRNLTHSLSSTASFWAYDRSSVSFHWAPHTHVYGLVNGLLLPLYAGGLALIMPAVDFISKPLGWLQVIDKYRVTHSGGPDFGYRHCLNAIDADQVKDLDLSCWKVAVSGGEPARARTLLGFHHLISAGGFELSSFCPAYGMSEVVGLIAGSPATVEPVAIAPGESQLQARPIRAGETDGKGSLAVSCGEPLQGLDIAIIDPERLTVLPEGDLGEICLSGPSVCSEYWGMQLSLEMVDLPDDDGLFSYFRTGDMGFLKASQLYLHGRLKEMIVLYGKKFSSVDIEIAASNAHERLEKQDNAAFSVENDGDEQVILIQEIPSEICNNTIICEDIVQAIKNALFTTHGLAVDRILLASPKSIPRTNSGKINRTRCKEAYLNEDLIDAFSNVKDREL